MITFVAEAVVSESVSSVDGVREVVKSLIQWTAGINDDIKPRAFAALLPTLCLLLDTPDSQITSPLHAIATTSLLGLAQSGPTAFKEATQAMNEGERGRLEKAVRDAVGQKTQAPPAAMEKRGIELKSFS